MLFRSQRKRAAIFEPTEEHCEFLLANKAMTRKKLLAAFHDKFGPVRATADGRRQAGSPAGGRGAPVQAGVTITIGQLKCARPKCDPEPTYTDAIDSIITREFKKGTSPEDVAAMLAAVPGMTARRVHWRWHRVLRHLYCKHKQPRQSDPRAASTRWTPDEQRCLAEATAIMAERGLHDEHCSDAGAPSECWEAVVHFMGTGRSPAAAEARFRTHVKEGRICMSDSCTQHAVVGSRFCEAHRPVYKIANTMAINECAAYAQEALDEGASLPTPPAVDGATCTDAGAVTNANVAVEARLRDHRLPVTSGGTFVWLALVQHAAATAHNTPPTRTATLAVLAPRARASTTKGFWYNVVVMAITNDVPVILETKVDKAIHFVAVLPGKVEDNYLRAVVVVLCPATDGPERAVKILSAHSSLYSKALFGLMLRQVFKVSGEDFGCRPPLARTP